MYNCAQESIHLIKIFKISTCIYKSVTPRTSLTAAPKTIDLIIFYKLDNLNN
jgi:hypothetical protein